MPNRLAGLLCGGVLLLALPAVAGAATTVDVRVEGTSKTLVSGRSVTLTDSPVVKDGNAAHSCEGGSAAGALERATRGDWTGGWSDGLGYFVSAIRGEKPAGSDFFTLWVNHRQSEAGLCDVTLKSGDDVLLFVATCDFDAATQACANPPATPLGIRVPKTVKRGGTLTLRVVDYSPAGKATVEKGASVFANGKRIGKTNSKGQLKVRATKAGKVSFYTTKAGKAKSPVVATRITRS